MNRHLATDGEVVPAHHERGASLVEYVLMLSLVMLVALASVSALGATVGESVDDSSSRIVAASGG